MPRLYMQPDEPKDAVDGDLWIATERPSLWERWMVWRGRLPNSLFGTHQPRKFETTDEMYDAWDRMP